MKRTPMHTMRRAKCMLDGRALGAVAALGACLLSAGCELLVDFDRTLIPAPDSGLSDATLLTEAGSSPDAGADAAVDEAGDDGSTEASMDDAATDDAGDASADDATDDGASSETSIADAVSDGITEAAGDALGVVDANGGE